MSKTIDISAINGERALFEAAENGWDKHSVFILVNQLGVNPDCRDYHSRFPLIQAAGNGRSGIIESLLAVGVDVNSQNSSGWTALHIAALGKHESCVRALMAAAHIDTSIRTNYGNTALDLAARRSVSSTMMKILKGEHVTVQTSSLVMDKGSADVNRVIKEAASGTLTNFLDSNSVSADVMSKVLSSGVINTSLENVLQAIWLGANRDSMEKAMEHAIRQESTEVVTALIDNGVGYRKGLLITAAWESNAVIVSKLIELGADVNEVTVEGVNAFQLALGNRLHGPAIREVLLSKGYIIRKKDIVMKRR